MSLVVGTAGILQDGINWWGDGPPGWQLQLAGFVLFTITVAVLLAQYELALQPNRPITGWRLPAWGTRWPWKWPLSKRATALTEPAEQRIASRPPVEKPQVIDPFEALDAHLAEEHEQKRALSAVELQFLSDLRRFIVALIACDRHLSLVIEAILTWDFHNRPTDPTREPLHRFFREYVNSREPQMDEVRRMAEHAQSGFELQQLRNRIEQYLLHSYLQWQQAIHVLNEGLRQDLDNYPQTKDWLEAEHRCLEHLDALNMSPARGSLAVQRAYFGCVGRVYRTGQRG